MKIKFADPAYSTFSGYFGNVEFKDGESIHDVNQNDYSLLSAIISIETIGEFTGEATYESSKELEAVTVNLPTTAELRAQAASAVAHIMAPGEPVETPAASRYTKEELEAIADKGGIAALRKVGDTFGVKDNKIVGLIAAILKAQEPVQKPADFLAEVPSFIVTEDSPKAE